MKKAILTVILTLVVHFSRSQVWSWANTLADGDCKTISYDPTGNLFMTGVYDGTISTSSNTISTPLGVPYGYVLKKDLNGNALWARNIVVNGGADTRVSSDPLGNAFVSGVFSYSLSLGTYTLTSPGNAMFIAKYDPNGNVLWAIKSGSSSSEDISGISTDAAGNAYLHGHSSATIITIGTFTTSSPNPGKSTSFVCKCDPNGNILWIKKIITPGTSFQDLYEQAITTDVSGNSYVTGYFSSATAVFGTYTLTNSSPGDSYIAKYNSTGTVVWAKNIYNQVSSAGISYDGSNNLYVTGTFWNTWAAFGTTTLTAFGTPGYGEMFISKYDLNGNCQWAKGTISQMPSGSGFGVSVSSSSTGIYVDLEVGISTAISGYTLIAPATIQSAYNEIIKFDPSGNIICMDDANDGIGLVSCSDAIGNAYLGGVFVPNPQILGPFSLSQAPVGGGTTVFAAMFNCALVSGIENDLHQKAVIISPAPNNGCFKLQVGNISNGELRVINALGQLVHSQKISGGSNDIHINGQASGLYSYLILANNQPVYSGKLVFQ